MIRIFLVEDEVHLLRSLKQKINDLGEPYMVAGTATNGTDALNIIPDVKPSILMTDIRMPEMDGITLIEKLREQGSDILPIIISGFQEFEYAKQAVRLGCQEYLLKPVDLEELRNCLDHCAQQLKQRKKSKNAVSFLIGDDAFSLQTVPDGDMFAVAYMIIANPLSNFDNIIHPRVSYIPAQEIAARMPPSISVNCFDGFYSNEKILILNGPDFNNASLTRTFEQLAEILEAHYKDSITIYFSTADKPEAIGSCIRTCRKHAVHCMILGKTLVASGFVSAPVPDRSLKERAELFTMLLRQKQLDLLYSNIRRMFTEWGIECRTTLAVQTDLIFLLDTLKHLSNKQNIYLFSSSFFVENILCFSLDEEELAENYYQLLVILCDVTKKTPDHNVSSEVLVEQTEQYFKDNLSSNITLQILSEEMNLSKVYLCRIFKKHKNMTPIDYYTHLRIARAKELIMQYPQKSLREVSDILGFNDVYYFSKVFKRITGLSPSEMRPTQFNSVE